jgi:hypothetical protein
LNVHALVYVGFIVLPVAVAIVIAWAGKSTVLTFSILLWMVLAAALARSGLLNHFNSMPPPMAVFLAAGIIGTIAAGSSRWARHLIKLPLETLIGFEAFRIVVEVLIHKASTLGLAPPQMTWSGYNFDIATGVTALCLAPFARSVPRWLIFIWNCLGLALLLVVVGIAAVSFPTRFQLIRPDNSWVADFPYVWLPSILVTAALLGHVIIFRKLGRKQSPAPRVKRDGSSAVYRPKRGWRATLRRCPDSNTAMTEHRPPTRFYFKCYTALDKLRSTDSSAICSRSACRLSLW